MPQEIWNTERIIRVFEQKSKTSIQVIVRKHNLSYSTIHSILKDEKLHAFHYTPVQHLRKEDYPLRKRF